MNASTNGRSVYVYDAMDEPIDWLTDRGVTVTLGVPVFSTGRMRPKMTEDALIEAASAHQALMGASGARITRRVIEKLPELRFISKLGIGCEVIDLAAATDHGILVTNTPVHSEVALVAEHAIALMLGVLKHLRTYSGDWLTSQRWKDPTFMSSSLRDATVGIIGFGHIGQAVAARLSGWGATLLANDVRPIPADSGVKPVDLETLLCESDVVTLHTPGGKSGEPPLLDAGKLALMKPTAILVNTARGGLVDMSALTAAVTEGRLAGAGIDVYNPEPPDPTHPLLSLPNVITTPHVAAWNRQLRKEMALMAFENLWSMFEGQVPASLVNGDVVRAVR